MPTKRVFRAEKKSRVFFRTEKKYRVFFLAEQISVPRGKHAQMRARHKDGFYFLLSRPT